MKNRLMGFVAGIIVSLIVFGLAGTAWAAYQKDATLYYNGITITLDGQPLTPRDTDGLVVEPFIMDGSTYLPVRGISEALGITVFWDGKNQAIYMLSPAHIDAMVAKIAWEATMDAILLENLNTSTFLMPNSSATKDSE